MALYHAAIREHMHILSEILQSEMIEQQLDPSS
jgi:hypothetical protein